MIHLLFASILFSANLLGESAPLRKSPSDLNDFYVSYLQSKSVESGRAGEVASALAPNIYRDAIQYENIADTIWVKVFITTDRASSQSALLHFKDMKIRALSQFGNIFAAKVNLLQLPELDRLSYVQRIEPVVPDGIAARASFASDPHQSGVKKK